jgi:predicted SAM-dependent methyltransferase
MSTLDWNTQHSHKYRVDPSQLPVEAQIPLIESAIRSCRDQGYLQIAIYPAGRHSRRLSNEIFERNGARLAAVLDDEKIGTMHGLSITKRADCPDSIDAIIISTDMFEHECAWRAQESKLPVFRPYAVLEGEQSCTNSNKHDELLRKLRALSTGKLNLGCGYNPIPGWTNIDGGDASWHAPPDLEDVIHIDVFDALGALENGSCSAIYSEHFYEHFSLDQGYSMACEWARLLRPGGVVRVVTPDLNTEARILLGDYRPEPIEVYQSHKRRWLNTRHASESSRFLTPAMLFNFGMRLDGHKFIYDFETLKSQLEAAGLANITRHKFGESDHPEMQSIDLHDGGETGGEWAKAIQLVVEARKP